MTDREDVGAMKTGGGCCPGQHGWGQGGRRYHMTYECHVRKLLWEGQWSAPTVPRLSFSWTHRSHSSRVESMWREGRTVNTQGRGEDIWRLSQVGESGDRRLYHFLPSYVYSWLTQCFWRRHVLGQDPALSTDKMHRRQDQEFAVRYIKNW